MKFNSHEVKDISMYPGDHEGRLVYKAPSKTLYETGYKEKWFKLKGNLLFYYQLNEDGVVEKIEPNGVFVLENVLLDKEISDAKYKNGFSLCWKDDSYKRHTFFSPIDSVLKVWMGFILRASYENLRAELLVLRLQIRQKSGKDPLEGMGTSIPVVSIRGVFSSPSKGSSVINRSSSSSALPDERDQQTTNNSFSSAPSSPTLLLKVPVPPPRTQRDKKKKRNFASNSYETSAICPKESTFQTHLYKKNDSDILDSTNAQKSSFKSHLEGGISHEELELFAK